MHKAYVIVPCVLLAALAVFERDAHRKYDAAIRDHEVARLAAKAAEEERRAIARRKAEADARARAEEREERERAREATRLREQTQALRELEAATVTHENAVVELQRELTQLQARSAALRSEQQEVNDAVFALARDVETQRIERRTAELEIQRTTRMVATRLAASEWAQPKPPAAPRPTSPLPTR